MMDITHSSLFLTCNYNDSWMQYVIYTYKTVSKLFVTEIPKYRRNRMILYRFQEVRQFLRLALLSTPTRYGGPSLSQPFAMADPNR